MAIVRAMKHEIAIGFVVFMAASQLFVTNAGAQQDDPGPMQARFRGCQSYGWCSFWIESRDPQATSLYRVYPAGVEYAANDSAAAVRNRLNALLSSMVHQHKRIVLYEFRQVEAGSYTAIVTVNEEDVAMDPVIRSLLDRAPDTSTPDHD